MPTLLEVQNALRKSLVDGDDGDAAGMLAKHFAPDRLDIYRNTFVTGVTKALQLSYPAVRRLVGEDFFAGAAAMFIARHPPRAAYLDGYDAEFAEFLGQFPPAATLVYLADVARLEWAASRAIHALDHPPFALTRLAAVTPADQGRISLIPHPSVGLVRARYPADDIWRAVLDRDDAALARLHLDGPPIHLLVERRSARVEVTRLGHAEWSFTAALCAGRPLQAVLDAATGVDATTLLAEHFAAERFIGFTLAPSKADANAA